MFRDTTNVVHEMCVLEITGATGIVTESLQKNVEAIPGEHHNM